jgi:FkbH-like protein
MPEPIRLIIWDLDETFWKGTLTEEGIEYIIDHQSIVIELSQRGIMNSICSKNDFSRVQKILKDHDVWDYFIFPSVNWEPKGHRVAAIVEATQLRAPTVLFIDDNPMNLKEAEHCIPGIQVADQTIISTLLANPLCKGKDDHKLSRLQQYKVLERRKTDEAAAGGNNVDFLRASDVRVQIEYDVEKHIDRAVELINRTNQLNFTKRRLPEDPSLAREALRSTLREFNVQAGLIRVEDKYGDYGFTGFYALRSFQSRALLIHFCFSCRTLGMGVETWIYRMLKQPELQVVGEVLVDLGAADEPVDWIRQRSEEEIGSVGLDAPTRPRIPAVRTRGGCEQQALVHYFHALSDDVVGEFNLTRGGIQLRNDHSLVLRYALEGLGEEALAAVGRLGFTGDDFTSKFLTGGPHAVRIFSVWMDANLFVYRHVRTGVRVPFFLPDMGLTDITRLTASDLSPQITDPDVANAVEFLRQEFTCEGLIGEELFKENISWIFHASAFAPLYVLLAHETGRLKSGKVIRLSRPQRLNQWLREVANNYHHVHLVNIAKFIYKETEIQSQNHFDRMVYFRLYNYIVSSIGTESKGNGMVCDKPSEHDLSSSAYEMSRRKSGIAASIATNS